jgi:antitoxin HicB
METPTYPFELRRLSEEEGGGWLITFPDLPGCMSDGESMEEAVQNGVDAERSWLAATRKWGGKIPAAGESAGGQIIVRAPKSLHAKLQARARQEGVSMNLLVATFIAEGLGRRETRS